MRKARIFLILGIWTALLPFLGFPYSWKNILSVITGLMLIVLSYGLYKESEEDERGFDNFRENDASPVSTKIRNKDIKVARVENTLTE